MLLAEKEMGLVVWSAGENKEVETVMGFEGCKG